MDEWNMDGMSSVEQYVEGGGLWGLYVWYRLLTKQPVWDSYRIDANSRQDSEVFIIQLFTVGIGKAT